jgi:hypothetical protein
METEADRVAASLCTRVLLHSLATASGVTPAQAAEDAVSALLETETDWLEHYPNLGPDQALAIVAAAAALLRSAAASSHRAPRT